MSQYKSFKNSDHKLSTLFEKHKELRNNVLFQRLENAKIQTEVGRINKKTQFINNIYMMESSFVDLNYVSDAQGSQYFESSFQNIPAKIIPAIKSEIIYQVGFSGGITDPIGNLPNQASFRRSNFLQVEELSPAQLGMANVKLVNWVYFNSVSLAIDLPPYRVKVLVQIPIPYEYL